MSPQAATIIMTTEDLKRLNRYRKALEEVRRVNGSPDIEQALIVSIYEMENFKSQDFGDSYGGTC